MLLSEFIKRQRKIIGVSQRQFAKKYGLSHVQIIKIERGELDSPSVLVAERLCNTFDIHPNELCSMLKNGNEDFRNNLSIKMSYQSFEDSCKKTISNFCNKYFVDNFEKTIEDKDVYNARGNVIGDEIVTIQDFEFYNTNDPENLKYNAIANVVSYRLNKYDIEGMTTIDNDGVAEEVAIYYLPTRRRDSCKTIRDFYRDFTDRFMNIIRSDYDGPEISLFITTSDNLFEEITKAYGNLDICYKHDKWKAKRVHLILLNNMNKAYENEIVILQ